MKEYEIEQFFSPTKYNVTHFYGETNYFPDLKSILLNKKYWNVDITKVNSDEYNDVHFGVIKKYNSRYSKYGPVEDMHYMDKIIEDLKNSVDSLFKEHNIQKEFAINNY